ncbi:MAG: hypothetical protein K2M29_08510, partial [Paramuribaculum sp.]|nr:hypothetical protein [Paramuribaculum sp.]
RTLRHRLVNHRRGCRPPHCQPVALHYSFGHPRIIGYCPTVYGTHPTSAASGRYFLTSDKNPEHLPTVGGRGYIYIRGLRTRRPYHLRVNL